MRCQPERLQPLFPFKGVEKMEHIRVIAEMIVAVVIMWFLFGDLLHPDHDDSEGEENG